LIILLNDERKLQATLRDQLGDSKGINSHITKSVVPMALALHKCTPTSNAIGMADFVTPTLVGGNAWTTL